MSDGTWRDLTFEYKDLKCEVMPDSLTEKISINGLNLFKVWLKPEKRIA